MKKINSTRKWVDSEGKVIDVPVYTHVKGWPDFATNIRDPLVVDPEQSKRLAAMQQGFAYAPAQAQLIHRIAQKPFGLITAEPGCGKTLIGLSVTRLRGAKRTLIVSPKGTCLDERGLSQWERQIRRFFPGANSFRMLTDTNFQFADEKGWPEGFYLTYYESFFRNEKSAGEIIRAMRKPLFDCCLLDECHVLANGNSRITQAVMKFQPEQRYAMSATPMRTGVEDLFPVMGWLCVPNWATAGNKNSHWPWSIDEIDLFRDEFCPKEYATHNTGYKPRRSPFISNPINLSRMVCSVSDRITKAQCKPDYVPPEVTVRYVKMDMRTENLYTRQLNRKEMRGGNTLEKAQRQVTKLRMICALPANPDLSLTPKTVAVFERAKEILEKRRKVIIVCAFVDQSQYLATLFRAERIPVNFVDSSTNHHAGIAEDFELSDWPEVLFMGCKCAVSHSFSSVHHMLIASMDFSPAIFDQTIGRIDRLDSKERAHVEVFLYRKTVEEEIHRRALMGNEAKRIVMTGNFPAQMPIDRSEPTPVDFLA